MQVHKKAQPIKSHHGVPISHALVRVAAVVLALSSSAAAALVQSVGLLTDDAKVAPVLARAHNAIGGFTRIDAIRSIVLRGEIVITPIIGSTTARPVELRYLWPDKFLQVSREQQGEASAGYDGPKLLLKSMSASPLPVSTQLQKQRNRAARLLVGMLLATQPVATLRASLVRQTEADETLAIRPDHGSEWIVTIGADSLPQSLAYRDEVRVPSGQPVSPRLGRGTLPPLEEREVMMRFSNRITFGGLKLPSIITTETAGLVLEELRFKSVVVGASLTPGDFRVTP